MYCIIVKMELSKQFSKMHWKFLFDGMVTQKLDMYSLGWALPRRPLRPLTSSGGRDLYLGGSLGSRVTWREQIAIPLLLKNGLSYFNPAAGACSGRLLPMEAVLMEHSRVLLFVITDNTRGVSAMALVSILV